MKLTQFSLYNTPILLCLIVLINTGCESNIQNQIFRESIADDLPKSGKTYGASVLDLNDDGRPDLIFSSHSNDVSLLLNQGGGQFKISDFGGPLPHVYDQHGAAACDYDNDGHSDVYLTAGAQHGKNWGLNQLWTWHDLGWDFGNDTAGILADKVGRGRGALWANFSGDIRPDLLVLNFRSPMRLLTQSSDGWQDQTSLFPVVADFPYWSAQNQIPSDLERSASVWSHGAAVGDFNGDGQSDLMVLGRAGASGLWLKSSTGNFVDRTSEYGLKSSLWPHTPTHVAVGDIDEDGWLDLVFSYRPDAAVRPRRKPLEVHLNRGGKKFREAPVTTLMDVPDNTDPTCCLLADLNNDGHLDLYVVVRNSNQDKGANLVFEGQGDGSFVAVTKAWGGQGPENGARESALIFDFDLDGDLDIVTLNGGSDDPEKNLGLTKYENLGTRGLGVTLELISRNGSPHGLGARVECGNQIRYVVSVASPFSSSILPVHFGLGKHSGPVEAVVYWPEANGATSQQNVMLPRAGAAYQIVKGKTECITLNP